jgi:predicted metalloprotease with PDZ domain
MPLPQNLSQPLAVLVRPLSLGMHEIEVEITLPAGAAEDGAVAALPAWTPGSYLVRDYARFLDRVKVTGPGGRPHPFEKIDKQSWRLAPSREELRITYRLFCNDLTVRTNHVDASHAHLVGAASFLYLEGQQARPFRVAFEGWPPDWRVATSLPAEDGAYLASDHDTLVDSPFELGTFRLHAFRVGACDFQLAVTGRHPGSEARIVEATAAVVEACGRIFGGFPFQRYLFLLTFSPKIRGGLEHRDSTSLLADPQQLEKAEGYWDLFTLIAHEFFHVWNVKRMRDRVLGPFDYGRENPTRLLWFHEGFTSFMQYAIVLKAGVVPWTWVSRRLGSSWTDNTTRPGRLEQSLESASFDAWIRHYKPTEFGINSTVSYYDKGALVAWMLDAQLRLASAGERGLEDLFRELWKRHGDGPVTDGDLRKAYQDWTGCDPETFWGPYIQGTAALDASGIEKAYGLKLVARAPWESLSASDAEDPDALRRARVYAGLTFQGGAPVVANVVPGSPAALAGLGYGMEILAVDGWRTASSQEVQNRIGDAAPGDPSQILAADRGMVAAFDLTLGENPFRSILVTADPKATQAQKAAFQAWTGLAFPGRRP